LHDLGQRSGGFDLGKAAGQDVGALDSAAFAGKIAGDRALRTASLNANLPAVRKATSLLSTG
jgi:hypothetical protein